jgi:hypothetical protein
MFSCSVILFFIYSVPMVTNQTNSMSQSKAIHMQMQVRLFHTNLKYGRSVSHRGLDRKRNWSYSLMRIIRSLLFSQAGSSTCPEINNPCCKSSREFVIEILSLSQTFLLTVLGTTIGVWWVGWYVLTHTLDISRCLVLVKETKFRKLALFPLSGKRLYLRRSVH